MRRVFFWACPWILLLWPALCGAPATSAVAQVHIPPAALVHAVSLDEVLRQGQSLEQERRWGDALSHYENALREHPERRDLQERLSVARAHLDIARRYADTSFVESLQQLTEQQALDLYGEVLLKIESYHVDAPDWGALVHGGVMHLRVAPTEPAFNGRFPQTESTDPGGEFEQYVSGITDYNKIVNRHQAGDTVAAIARMATQQLGVTTQAAVLEFTCAAAHSLDPYSSYLTGDQLDELFAQIEGNFVGLGIELKADNDSLLIVNVIPGGPAEEAGIVAQDRIVEVDGRTMREVSTDAAADLLKGPELSYVTVVVRKPDATLRSLRVQRRRVEVPSVQDAAVLDRAQGVAYMKLSSFQKTTSRDVDNALWSLHRRGMRVLIMDLRGNPGGLLNAAVEVADKFLSSGTIVSTRGRSAREDFDYQAHSVGTWRVPLVVLIDGDSASASEILAGAIRDHNRGTVVGQRSYGKGSVQGIFPLSRYKAGIRLTTAKFYAPSGEGISHRGVMPHIVVRHDDVHTVARPTEQGEVIAAKDDATLDAAVDVARQAVNSQVRRARQGG
jgi:carboxyl-terminal processing protease